jgi:hypothetical protein
LISVGDGDNDREIYEDYLAIENLRANVKKDPLTNKYSAALLWNKPSNEIQLPTKKSVDLAIKRMLIMEKVAKMQQNVEECELQVKNLLKNNYARELSEQEIKEFTPKSYYIPIFFIHPANKRLRMIWDMAALIDGKSVNDQLLSGPNLYNNIVKILFQMREHQYLIKGDLAEMFHQINIIEEDTEALRFVYRFEGESKIRHFKMLVLPFGAKCSPTIAHYVKNKVAIEKRELTPLTSDIMQNSTYVDDVVTSLKDKDTALKTVEELKKNFLEGGFELMKIASNDKEINEVVCRVWTYRRKTIF